jgi:hypothetical protein
MPYGLRRRPIDISRMPYGLRRRPIDMGVRYCG